MYILNISLAWFKTIPGILITCGAILLIIALIIFIVSSKKSKKDKTKNSMEEFKEESVNDLSEFGDTTNVINNNSMEGMDVKTITDVKIEHVSSNQEPVSIAPVNFVETPSVVEEVKTPVMDIPVEFTPTITQNVEMPMNNSANVEEETVQLIEPTPVSVVEVQPQVNLEQTMVSVFPTQSNIEKEEVPQVEPVTIEEVKPVIYGGNDPLESTQKIPVGESMVNRPYGGAPTPEATVQAMNGGEVKNSLEEL